MVLGKKIFYADRCSCVTCREPVICRECRKIFCGRCQAMEIFQKHDGNTIRIMSCPRCLCTDLDACEL